jgi:hypothetical protein
MYLQYDHESSESGKLSNSVTVSLTLFISVRVNRLVALMQ